MSITKEQQQALDDALVPREQRLTIGTFLITASVPVIYIQEFWATVSSHKHHIRFKMNKKSYSFDMETFRSMLQMCPKLLGQQFVDPPFEKDILTFMREMSYPANIKLLSDVKVDTLPQPWRTFGTIINKCLSDKSISRRNKVDWHMANDDPILTTMIFIPQHKTVQKYGAILPDYLTNQAMKASEAYKTYHDLATGKLVDERFLLPPKQTPPEVDKQSCTSLLLDLLAQKGYTDERDDIINIVLLRNEANTSDKRVKATAKVAKSGKKKQPALGLETLSDIALTKAKQMKLATKRSLIQTHSSHAIGSGTHERTGVIPGVPNAPIYRFNDEEIYWKSSDEEDDDDEVNSGKDEDVDDQDDDENADHSDDDEQTESDDEGDDFVHPKFTTLDDEVRHEEDDKEEETFDPIVHTPFHAETTDDEVNDDETQGANVKGEEMDEEAINAGGEDTDLHRDVNVNLEGQDVKMTDAQQTNVQTTQVIEDTHYLGNRMNDAVKTAVQLQSKRLREKAQAENQEFLKTINDGMKKIIKEQVKAQVKDQVSKILPKIEKLVNDQLESEVLICSSNEAKTSHAGAVNLSELELKKILIDKMEANKLVDRTDIQKNLYKELVDAYEADKDILDAYGDIVTIKHRRDDADDDEEPSAGSNRGSKRRISGKEPESTSALKEKTPKSTSLSKEGSKSKTRSTNKSAQVEEPVHTVDDLEQPTHQEFDTGLTEDQPTTETTQDDDKLYRFKEGDFNRLRIQDIKDMLLLLVQGKLTNLTVEECLAFNVSLRMFTRSVVIQRPGNGKGTDVDIINGYGYGYIKTRPESDPLPSLDAVSPTDYLRQRDKDNAGAMIQAIDKQLKTRKIMRSLEKFVSGRPYEGDFRLLQRTI
nr:hypothetical protein [Tanacetum cinerariifolium]